MSRSESLELDSSLIYKTKAQKCKLDKKIVFHCKDYVYIIISIISLTFSIYAIIQKGNGKSEINESIPSNEEYYNKFKEINDKIDNENALLRNKINEINIQYKEIGNKFSEENTLLINQINELKRENKELREIENKNSKDNELLNNQMNKIIVQYEGLKEINNKLIEENALLKTQINETKIEIKKFKEIEDKLLEDNSLLNNKINEAKIQYNEIREIEVQLVEENSLLNSQVNETKIQYKELREIENKLSDDNILIKDEIKGIQEENKLFKENDDRIFSDFSVLYDQINIIYQKYNELEGQMLQKYTKLQSGDYLFDFYSPESEYKETMESLGWREFKYHVDFDIKYDKKPKVLVSINQLDNDKSRNVRINAFAADIDNSGFDLKIQTWDDTLIVSARIAWVSFD